MRLLVVLFVLLQLLSTDVLARDEDDGYLSTWEEADTDGNIVGELEEEFVPEKANEEAERPHFDTDLNRRERLVAEADTSWQEDNGDVASDLESKVETQDGAVYDAYPERQRHLEEQAVGDDEDDEEALPVIPGLTDVELIAFNPEFANAEVLDKIIDWSYDQVAALSRYRDTYIHVEDLYDFLLKTLNPLDEEIDTEDKQILTDAVVELRKQQGLLDDEQIVYRGFIARGMPLRFLQSLAHEMHQTVQTRRLQANTGRDEL